MFWSCESVRKFLKRIYKLLETQKCCCVKMVPFVVTYGQTYGNANRCVLVTVRHYRAK
jgi:hypothetical protein